MQQIFRLCLLVLMATVNVTGAWAQAPDHDHKDDPKHQEARPFGGGEANYDYFLRMSDMAFHEGDYERAIACHRAILALEPDAVDSYGVAAWLLWSLGKGDEATTLVERGIATNPADWEMMDEAAQHFDVRKIAARAAPLYKRALELMPKDQPNQMLRRRLAHASEKAGDLAASVNIWRGLVQDFPAEAVNKNNLARVEQMQAGTKK